MNVFQTFQEIPKAIDDRGLKGIFSYMTQTEIRNPLEMNNSKILYDLQFSLNNSMLKRGKNVINTNNYRTRVLYIQDPTAMIPSAIIEQSGELESSPRAIRPRWRRGPTSRSPKNLECYFGIFFKIPNLEKMKHQYQPLPGNQKETF